MAKGLAISFIGQLPSVDSTAGQNKRVPRDDDYRAVPSTDVGNRDYSDRGMLGGWTTPSECFDDPAGLVRFTGYGGNRDDLERGYIVPTITEDPAYDKRNYVDRWSDPSHPYIDQLNTDAVQSDWEFRSRNRESRGFLTRPRLPTERG
jgi:hypothetical protein